MYFELDIRLFIVLDDLKELDDFFESVVAKRENLIRLYKQALKERKEEHKEEQAEEEEEWW